MTKLDTNKAWKKLIEKYNIIEKIENEGQFRILSKQIKEFREPRLMAKWDSTETLPKALKNNNLNILPDSRSSYILSDFELYEKFPQTYENVNKMKQVNVPHYETLDINNITSESNAINLLLLSNILDDFLEVERNVQTFNGRMGSGNFDFYVNTKHGKEKISVNNAQIEIDAGFENDESVVIMEAKNVVYPDFHIRQLYYPYRLWRERVKKPIRLVFSVYSNKIYRLYEYEFESLEDYSSIKLIKSKNYSFEDTKITQEDLIQVYKNTIVKTDDRMENGRVPFIQADTFENIIALLEQLYENSMNIYEIAEFLNFDPRQSDYYFNAGKYLGLFEKIKDVEKGEVLVHLTDLGKKIFKMNYKERQLKLVELILEHKIFNDFFFSALIKDELPSRDLVKNKMREYNVCSENLVSRRSSSVLSWLKWMIDLPKL